MKVLRLALVGFGHVNQEFCRLLIKKHCWIMEKYATEVQIVAVSTLAQGNLISSTALDIAKILDEFIRDMRFCKDNPYYTEGSGTDILQRAQYDVMVEATTLNIFSGEPAVLHIKTALEKGSDVISVNKGPLAWKSRELLKLAKDKALAFFFEGTVMDGFPIFNYVEKCLPGCKILGFSGIFNSTTNFIIDRLSQGATYDDALREAQTAGFAEADPAMDIEGWDAAAKTAVLANILMSAELTPENVERIDLSKVDLSLFETNNDKYRYKIVANCFRNNEIVSAKIKLEKVDCESPFYAVGGASSAIILHTDLMGEIILIEKEPDLLQTAYAVFVDLLRICDWRSK